MFGDGKNSNLYRMSHGLNAHRILGIDVLTLKKIADIRSCSPNMSPALTSLWKHRSVLCTHLCFQVTVPSFLPLFLCPRRSHSPADIDQSPWLYLLCVLWQNRRKWQRRWRRRQARGSKQTSGSLAMALAVIKWADAAWCKPLSALGSPDRKSSHSDSCSRFIVIRYCPPVNDVSLTKTGWTPTAVLCKWLWHFLKMRTHMRLVGTHLQNKRNSLWKNLTCANTAGCFQFYSAPG